MKSNDLCVTWPKTGRSVDEKKTMDEEHLKLHALWCVCINFVRIRIENAAEEQQQSTRFNPFHMPFKSVSVDSVDHINRKPHYQCERITSNNVTFRRINCFIEQVSMFFEVKRIGSHNQNTICVCVCVCV